MLEKPNCIINFITCPKAEIEPMIQKFDPSPAFTKSLERAMFINCVYDSEKYMYLPSIIAPILF